MGGGARARAAAARVCAGGQGAAAASAAATRLTLDPRIDCGPPAAHLLMPLGLTSFGSSFFLDLAGGGASPSRGTPRMSFTSPIAARRCCAGAWRGLGAAPAPLQRERKRPSSGAAPGGVAGPASNRVRCAASTSNAKARQAPAGRLPAVAAGWRRLDWRCSDAAAAVRCHVCRPPACGEGVGPCMGHHGRGPP